MTAVVNAVQKDSGPSAAGQVLAPTIDTGAGAPASMATATINSSGVYGGDYGSATSSYCGFRREIALDLSDNPYVACQVYTTVTNIANSLAAFDSGGVRLLFEDGSGNWSGFKVMGKETAWSPTTASSLEGGWGAYGGIGSSVAQPVIFIDRAKTPDYSSGTLDWSDIVAWEIHISPSASIRWTLIVAKFITTPAALITGATTTNLSDVQTAWSSGNLSSTGSWRYFWGCRQQIASFGASPLDVYVLPLGLSIGDGSTATTVSWDRKAFILRGSPAITKDSATGYRDQSASILASDPRKIDINQAATCSYTFNDCLFASTDKWGVNVGGSTSGTCAFNRTQFWNFNYFVTGHGAFTDCIWDSGTEAVEINTTTVVTRGTVRNGVGHGIKITSGAGSYTNLDIDFDDNSTYDIELGSGGAGNYVLTGIAGVGGSTVKIRNDSATNAITVEVASGVTTSTSTAGGTITVTAPALYQKVIASGFTAGSRIQIYDTTSATELFNGTASAGDTVISGSTATWTDPTAAAADRAIRVRVAYVNGTSAEQWQQFTGLTCGQTGATAEITYPVTPIDDDTYNSNAIDGPTIYATSGITFTDAATDLVNISIAGGAVTWQTIYACFVYWLFTAAGIDDDVAYIDAPDPANYLLTSMKLKNTHANPLTVTGGYGRSATTGLVADIIDTAGSTGNIFPSPDHVVAYATGSGALTAGDITNIWAAATRTLSATQDANIVQVAGITVDGTGTDGDPWGPA